MNIHVIDQDALRRGAIARLVYDLGWHVEISTSIDEFRQYAPNNGIVLLNDELGKKQISSFFKSIRYGEAWLQVIAYSCQPKPWQIVDAVRLGVSDYLAYPIDSVELLDSQRRVQKFGEARRQAFLNNLAARKRVDCLTRRQDEVLRQMIHGKTNAAIAQELGISRKTVEIHRGQAIAKLGAANSAEAIRIGVEAYLEIGSIGD